MRNLGPARGFPNEAWATRSISSKVLSKNTQYEGASARRKSRSGGAKSDRLRLGGHGSMSILPPDKPAEFTASDILSADAWSGRAPKPVLGIDVACTKIAVDFQNMRRETVDECVRRNLELLREATASDCAFLIAFSPNELVIQDVQLARGAFAQCRPEGLQDTPLERFPWL